MIKIIRDNLPNMRGDACLVWNEATDEYFVVSTITKAQFAYAYGDIETLAFRSDEDGNIDSWADVAGGGDMTREDVIAQLETGNIDDWETEDDSYFSHEDIDYLFDDEYDSDDSWYYGDND